MRALHRPDLAFSLWCGTKRLVREGRDWPARLPGQHSGDPRKIRPPALGHKTHENLVLTEELGVRVLAEKLPPDQSTTLSFCHRLSSGVLAIVRGYVLSATLLETGRRRRRGGGRGPVCGPAECGGGAVLHAPSLAPVAPLRHHLHRPTYCVTRHAPSSRRCVVDFSTFSRVFRIFSFR